MERPVFTVCCLFLVLIHESDQIVNVFKANEILFSMQETRVDFDTVFINEMTNELKCLREIFK